MYIRVLHAPYTTFSFTSSFIFLGTFIRLFLVFPRTFTCLSLFYVFGFLCRYRSSFGFYFHIFPFLLISPRIPFSLHDYDLYQRAWTLYVEKNFQCHIFPSHRLPCTCQSRIRVFVLLSSVELSSQVLDTLESLAFPKSGYTPSFFRT